jgi:hypothetical protein
MSYTSPQSIATVSLNHPETAMSKQSIYGKSMFGSKSEHLPRITLCPASFYGCDPITLYEPPKSAMAKVTQYLRLPFRRQPKLDLSASYDSFSKPPSWMKHEDKESMFEERKSPVKKRRCMSTLAFCLGFLIATASVLIAMAMMLAHTRLIQRDDVVPAESDHMVIRQQVDMLDTDPAQAALYNINLFNNMLNNGTTTQPLRTQLEETSYGFTTKPKSQSIEIEPKAMRPIYNIAVVSYLHLYITLKGAVKLIVGFGNEFFSSHIMACLGPYLGSPTSIFSASNYKIRRKEIPSQSK